jgi:hypothetical protein
MKSVLQDRLGRRYEVPQEEAPDALAAGLKPIDPEVLRQEEVDLKYGNKVAQAILLAGSRGLTLGLSDQLLTKTGLMEAEDIKGIKEASPIASTIGEIGGAVAPALLTGGTSLAARAAALTPAGAAANLAVRSGSKVAEKVAQKIVGDGLKQQVAKKALELGTIGLVEGALFGEAQLITEEALGDAEFTAEAILGAAGTGAMFGAGAGAAMGAFGAVANRGLNKVSKGYKKRLVENRTDLTPTEKADLIKAVEADEAMLNTINLSEKQGVREAAERLGVTPTPGTLSAEPSIGKLESSIGGGGSIPAVNLRAQREALDEGLQDAAKKLIEGAPLSKVDAGDAIRLSVRDQMLADLGDAPTVYKAALTEFGKMQPNPGIITRIRNRVTKEDSYRGLLKNERSQVTELIEMLEGAENFNQLNNLKKNIGQRLSAAVKDQNFSLADSLGDLYRTAGRAEEEAIELAARMSYGEKEVKMWLDGWDEAKKKYASFYKKYESFAKDAGIKSKNAQGIIDQLGDANIVKAERLAKKFIDLNDVAKAKKLAEEFPESFDVARRQRLNEILSSSKGVNGQYNLPNFLKKIEKLDDAQKKILLSDDYAKVIKDIDTVVKALPPNINPSGTDFANAWRSILSPIYQATEYARYALYKGGARGLRNYFDKGLPMMAAAESAINQANIKINSASKGYFKALRQAVNYSGADQMSEQQIKRVEKVLDKLQTDPADFLEELARKSKDFTVSMPQTSNALQGRLLAATEFMASKFPKRNATLMNDDYQASKSDLIKFSDYMLAIEKPFKAIEQLKSGYLNPRAMEALKHVYPKLFSKLQQDLTKNMPKNLTPAQRAQLTTILGAKVSPIYDRRNFGLLQSGVEVDPNQPIGQAPQSPRGQPTPRKPDLKQASRTQGSFDSVVNRRV